MAYLLDSNVFISAKRTHYGFDFCPGFWNWIVSENAAGNLFSVRSVYDELIGQQDDLSDWIRQLPATFFIAPDAGTSVHFQAVSNWAATRGFTAPAINTFLQSADYYLVAQAMQQNHTVVTYEVVGGSTKKIKIPDACLAHAVECLQPHSALRRSGARFVLGGNQ